MGGGVHSIVGDHSSTSKCDLEHSLTSKIVVKNMCNRLQGYKAEYASWFRHAGEWPCSASCERDW